MELEQLLPPEKIGLVESGPQAPFFLIPLNLDKDHESHTHYSNRLEIFSKPGL